METLKAVFFGPDPQAQVGRRDDRDISEHIANVDFLVIR